MKFRFTGLTDPGLVRSANQDAYHVDPQGRFAIVADGMGGHTGGEEASRIAVEVTQAYLTDNWDSQQPNATLLENALLQANQAIVQEQQKQSQLFDMGTTAVVVIFRQQQPYCAHVGDSRLYRLRASKLEQITQDQTWVAQALKFGDLTAEECRIHPYRHILLSCLGRPELKEIEIQPLDIQTGDRLLLCSDGLTEELSDDLITFHLQSQTTIDQASMALLEGALTNGGQDNITIVIVAAE